MNSSILFGNMRKNLTGQFQMETLDKATKARLEAAVLQRDLIPFFPPPSDRIRSSSSGRTVAPALATGGETGNYENDE